MPEQETITQQEGSTIAKNHGIMKPQSYKSDLFHRLNWGGTLDFAILACCERIMNDPRLFLPFYRSIDMTSLRILQKEMLIFAIATDIPKHIDAKARIYLRHYQLFDMGFNESHFDLQIGHLVAALHESWVEQDVIDDVEASMGAFRVLFESRSSSGTTDDKTMAKKCLSQKAIHDKETKRGVGRNLS
jgi:hypothetical protein